MRILTKNAAEDATITATNDSLNYPPENLVHDFLHARLQMTADTENTITITFDSAETVNCLFFAYHNINYLNVKLYRGLVLMEELQSGAGSIIYTEDREDTMMFLDDLDEYFIDGIGEQSDCLYFSQAYAGITSAVITVYGEEESYIGGIGVGEYYQLPDPKSDFTEGLIDNSVVSRSVYGQSLHTKIDAFESGSYSFRGISRSTWQEIRDLFTGIGAGAHVWVDFFEGNHEYKLPKYSTWDALTERVKRDIYYDFTVTFTEAR